MRIVRSRQREITVILRNLHTLISAISKECNKEALESNGRKAKEMKKVTR